MKTIELARTTLNLPILSHQFGNSGKKILILASVHGDEIEGTALARNLLSVFMKDFNYKVQVHLIPEFNPEGVLLKTRMNYNGVDLNRNLPTLDWSDTFTTLRYFPGPYPLSEVENRALTQLIENEKFDFIISLHSWKPLINVNGPSLPQAELLNKWTGYVIEHDMGYPTPGSLGTYTGKERHIPTITYEIERGLRLDLVIANHTQPMLELIKSFEA